MADFTLSAPGTTNNPWTPANVLTPLGSTVGLKTDTNGWRAISSTAASIWAHNANYSNTITTTITIGTGATSNGDQIYMGTVVRSGANAGGGVGIIIDAFIVAGGWWNAAGTTFTKITSADTSITRANSDVWSVKLTLSAGSWAISNVTQNGVARALNGTTSTTQFGAETSAAAGAAYVFGNNDSLYLTQFTGTGVSGSNTGITPTVGSETITGNAPTVTPATNTVVTPFVARHGSGLLEPDHRLVLPIQRKIFLPTFRKVA